MKKRFIVDENETIDACIERMKEEGYTPIRRLEEPIFKETVTDGNGIHDVQPCGRKIIFEGKLEKTEQL